MWNAPTTIGKRSQKVMTEVGLKWKIRKHFTD